MTAARPNARPTCGTCSSRDKAGACNVWGKAVKASDRACADHTTKRPTDGGAERKP